jgi:hypothetical protein
VAIQRPLACLVGIALTMSVLPARGEEAQVVERRLLPRARLDLGYALSFRDDSQSVNRVDVSAKGMTPTHLRFDGAVWFGDLPIGLAAVFGWERFSLTGNDLLGDAVTLTAIGLNVAGGLAGRIDIRGWALEGNLGWAWARLPVVNAVDVALRSGSVQSHGPMIAVRFGLPTGFWLLPDVHVSAIPYAFASTPSGASHGWRLDAGAGFGLGALPLGGAEWSAVLGYDYSLTQVDGDGGKYSQGSHQVSVALRVTIPGSVRVEQLGPTTGSGRIKGLLLDADGKPMPAHLVEVVGLGPVQTDGTGAFKIERAGPGQLTLRATAPGLKPAEQTVDVAPETEVAVELRLSRPTGPGLIRGLVFSKPAKPGDRAPVVGAQVEAAGIAPVQTDEKGAFLLDKVGPGLVPLKVSAKGFVSGEEVVSVPPEAEAKVELSIVPEKAKPLATLRGLVRAVGGKPLAAQLTIPEAKIGATAGANGEFSFSVPGGHYKVRVEAPGYLPQVKTVDVADGDQAIFNIDMHPAK